MDYLKLFNNHSGYTEYIEGDDVVKPNVSHCIQEDEVHYMNRLPDVLPENAEVWELYSSLVCDDERLEQDLRNIFSKYQVSTSPCSNRVTQSANSWYTDNGTRFSYTNEGMDRYKCDIFTSRQTNYEAQGYALSPVTNDCGQDVLPGGVGSWGIYIEQGQVGPILS